MVTNIIQHNAITQFVKAKGAKTHAHMISSPNTQRRSADCQLKKKDSNEETFHEVRALI